MTRLSLIYRTLARFRHQTHANPYFGAVEKAKQTRRRVLGLVAGVASVGLILGFGYTFLEARRLTAIEISGLQYLDQAILQEQIGAALEKRNFLGIQYWYAGQVPVALVAQSLKSQPLELQGVERVGSTLKVAVAERVVKGGIERPDGWHILGAQAETIAVVPEAPANVPLFTGPVNADVLSLVDSYNSILRRNNEALINAVSCNEESLGAWCSTPLKGKIIYFDPSMTAENLAGLLEPLWARPESNLDVRFEGRIYLR